MADTWKVESERRAVEGPADQYTIRNLGPDTLYYGGPSVSSSDTQLAAGAQVTVAPTTWLISAGQSRVTVAAVPVSPSSGSSAARYHSVETIPQSAVPPVSAAPPTFTAGASGAATAIAGSVLVPWTDPRIRVVGAVLTQMTGDLGAYAANLTVTQPDIPAAVPAHGIPAGAGAQPFSLYFVCPSQQFEIEHNGAGGARLRIAWDNLDGTGWQTEVEATWSARNIQGSVFGDRYRDLVDFGSRPTNPRLVRLDCAGVYINGIRVAATEAIWAPTFAKGPRVVVCGDSFTNGTAPGFGSGSAGQLIGLVGVFGRRMGWPDTWWSGVGSTGYVNDGTAGGTQAGRVPIPTRLQHDVLQYTPDVVVFTGGRNDVDTTNAAIYPAGQGSALTVLRAALDDTFGRTVATGAKLVATGPMASTSAHNTSSAAATNFIGVRDQIKAACLAAGGTFIDNIAQAWITGSGRVGATAGDGNADRFIGTDGVHPSREGHLYIGARLASALQAAAPSWLAI